MNDLWSACRAKDSGAAVSVDRKDSDDVDWNRFAVEPVLQTVLTNMSYLAFKTIAVIEDIRNIVLLELHPEPTS